MKSSPLVSLMFLALVTITTSLPLKGSVQVNKMTGPLESEFPSLRASNSNRRVADKNKSKKKGDKLQKQHRASFLHVTENASALEKAKMQKHDYPSSRNHDETARTKILTAEGSFIEVKVGANEQIPPISVKFTDKEEQYEATDEDFDPVQILLAFGSNRSNMSSGRRMFSTGGFLIWVGFACSYSLFATMG